MVHKDFRENRFKTRDEDYVGQPEESATEPVEIVEEAFPVEAALMDSAESVIVTMTRDVVVDGEFVFPLDYNWMNMLIWKPAVVGERLKGTYEGCILYNWSDDDAIPEDKYYVVRVNHVDRIIPAWSAVEKSLERVSRNTLVLLIYGGTIQLKNGRTFHRILVGSNIPLNDPLVE